MQIKPERGSGASVVIRPGSCVLFVSWDGVGDGTPSVPIGRVRISKPTGMKEGVRRALVCVLYDYPDVEFWDQVTDRMIDDAASGCQQRSRDAVRALRDRAVSAG